MSSPRIPPGPNYRKEIESKEHKRSKTIGRKQMLRERKHRQIDSTTMKLATKMRPRTRRECMNQKRPCLFIACKYHLYLDVNPETGSIKFNFPDKEVWELEETCALDVAARGGVTLEEIGKLLNLTRERIRQLEVSGLHKLLEICNENDADELKDLID